MSKQEIETDLLPFIQFFHFGKAPPLGVETLHNMTSSFMQPPPRIQPPAVKPKKPKIGKATAQLKKSNLTDRGYVEWNMYEHGRLNQNVDEFLSNILNPDPIINESSLEIENNEP